MKKNFLNSIQVDKIDSNAFDLSHDVKMSARAGVLTPVLCQEAIPGDKYTITQEMLIRMAPMLAPIMHRINACFHTFFVPNRLVWPGWEKFITGDGDDLPAFPTIGLGDTETVVGSLPDYLGVPILGSEVTRRVNAIPFAAYQMIYNDYYRDQNLIPEVDFELIDGNNDAKWLTDLGPLRRRAWEHDLFTAALPTPQKGTPVDIPLGEVVLKNPWLGTNPPTFRTTTNLEAVGDLITVDTGGGNSAISAGSGQTPLAYDPEGTLQTEATTINDLRMAFRLQEWLEKSMRGGSRYIESILVHFGVQSDDARLQRPEYITGSVTPISISEVLNTTGTEDAPQGDMAGHGVAVTGGDFGSYYCKEHGFIMTILSIMPRSAYQQGFEKYWLKTLDRYQYFWPTFAHLGEEGITNEEVYADQEFGQAVFGYLPRYYDYRMKQSRSAGDFKTTLSFWTMTRIFSTPPALNKAFVECTPRTDIFAVPDGVDHYWMHILHKIKAVRKIPIFGTPGGV